MKYKKYDHVQIKDLSMYSSVRHFPNNIDAIVLYSCREQYQDDDEYCLWVNGRGVHSWYSSDTFDLLEHDRKDLLDKWKDELAKAIARESDLDYIFSHGKEIAQGEGYNGVVAEALYKCLTSGTMWGSRGEGISFYMNAVAVHNLAKPFLEAGDKDGWLKFCNVRCCKAKDADPGRVEG